MTLRICTCFLLSAFWLVPFLFIGINRNLVPNVNARLSHQYSAAGLFFPKRAETWTQMFIQVRKQGDEKWQTVKTAELSPMGAFGYRQRLDRILQEATGKAGANEVMRRLALWVAKKCEQLNPKLGQIISVRFGAVLWPSNSEELTRPETHWLSDPAVSKTTVPYIFLSSFTINQGTAELMAKPTHMKLSPIVPPVTNSSPQGFRRSGRQEPNGASPLSNDIPPIFRRNRSAAIDPSIAPPDPQIEKP